MAATCACGAPTTPRSPRCRRCACRLAQAKYQYSSKGRATEARYTKSAARHASRARYYAGAARQRSQSINNARRIFIGRSYHSRAKTTEQATMINAHIKQRVHVLKQGFKNREKAEGVSSGAVSTQAAV